MAELSILSFLCGVCSLNRTALQDVVMRGKKAAQQFESVDSHIRHIDTEFMRNTPNFKKASRDDADRFKKEVKDAFNDIKKPPPRGNPSTIAKKWKYKVLLRWYGFRHGKKVERKLVALDNLINRYEEAVTPSGEKTRHAYVEGSPIVTSVSAVGLDRADKIVGFLRDWKATWVNATEGALSCKLCFVGIVGHGGLGKTTLLGHSLSRLKQESNGFEIVAEIELSDKVDSEDLKEKQASLINQLLQGVATYEKPQTLRHGQSKLKEVFEGLAQSKKSVCITIDDVWNIENLGELLPVMTIPSFTCCIIVTSQVQDIMKGLKQHFVYKNTSCLYQTFELEPLSEEDSKRLLVAHATDYDEASSNSTLANDEVSRLAEGIFPYCCNLPKALKLTGNKLANENDPSFWDQWKLDMAEGKPGLAAGLEPLGNLLDRGYQKLNGESQAAVCGIAACFHGWPRQTAINIVDNSVIKCIENLSLLPVNVPMESSLKMQGLIRKLAQACAESRNDIKWALEPNWSTSRLKNGDFEQVRYLRLDVRNACEFQDHLNFEGSCFERMRQLQALDMLGPFNCIGLLQFPESLLFLRFQHNHCLKKVFESVKFPSRLRHLELDGCKDLRELPVTAYNCGSLLYVRIVSCPDLIGLRGTQNTQWMNLQVLHLEDCPSIIQLPDLRELGRLIVNNCKGLEESQNEGAPKLSHGKVLPVMPSDNSQASSSSLPPAQCNSSGIVQVSFCSLPPAHCDPSAAPFVSAETLNAAEVSINKLHEPTDKQVAQPKKYTISEWNNLSHDEVSCLTNLIILARDEPHQRWSPSQEMICLKQLKLIGYGCHNLERNLFAKTSQLTKLGLKKCLYLTELDDSLGSLKLLEKFTLKNCYKLERLPDTIANLLSLRRLGLEGCANIQRLPCTLHNCVSLEELSLQMCSSLECLPQDMATMKSLKIIRLNQCNKLIADLWSSIGALAEHQLDELELVGLYSEASKVPDAVRKASRSIIV